MDESSIRMAFDEYDKDASGRISARELEMCLKKYGFNAQRARDIAREVLWLCDKTKDRKLNYDEFKDAIMREMLPDV